MSSISSRMNVAFAALLLCTIALCAIAWKTQSQQAKALASLYENIVVEVRDLKIISDRYAVDIVDAAHKARNGNVTFQESSKAMKSALTEIDKLWGQYVDNVSNQDEKTAALVQQARLKLTTVRGAALTLIELIEKGKKAELENFIVTEMYDAIDPGTELLGKLAEAELERGKLLVDEAYAAGSASRKLLIAISALAILVCGISAAYVVFTIVRPLKRSVATMNDLARYTVGSNETGETRLENLASVEISGANRKDELGEMARTLLTFKETGIERQRLRLESEGDLKARQERSQQIEALISEFEASSMSIVSSVATTSAELEASAKMMLEVAQTATEQSAIVATASHQTSESVQILSSTGDDLAMSINEIGRQAEQSSRFASTAAEKARATDSTVQRLNLAGQAIVEVIDLIKSIASQTNLLALNATIEAARAGESDRGFAVVASEVKELASQTSRATDVISEHVNAIQLASGDSIEAMREITRMIEEINQVASSIAAAVTEQSQATQGIADNVQQVAQGTAHAASSIAIVNEAAANTGAAAGQVLSASEELANQSQMMQRKVDTFLHAVRMA